MILGRNSSYQRDLLIQRYEGALLALPTLKTQQSKSDGALNNPEGDKWSSLENEIDLWVMEFINADRNFNIENASFIQRRIEYIQQEMKNRGFNPNNSRSWQRYQEAVSTANIYNQ